MNEMVKGSQLGLGDRVRLGDWPHSTATVVQITPDEIRLIRPYVHTGDSYSGNQVLWYLGVEDFKVSISGNFVRVYKSEPPR